MEMYNLFNKLKHGFYRAKTAIWYRLFLKGCGEGSVVYKPILMTPQYLSLGSKVQIRNNARIEGVLVNGRPNIQIGNNVNIEQNVHITCGNSVFIGEDTAIAANVTISDINHTYEDVVVSPKLQPLMVSQTYIGSHCTVYNNSVILPGAHIGNRCIVAANSVVPGKTYPDYCVLAGAPAKIVKRYNAESQKWEGTDADGNFHSAILAGSSTGADAR